MPRQSSQRMMMLQKPEAVQLTLPQALPDITPRMPAFVSRNCMDSSHTLRSFCAKDPPLGTLQPL